MLKLIRPFKFISLLALISCAQVSSLNLKKHQFGRIPTKLIWLQIDGLGPEHLALLKYTFASAETKTSFEEFTCLGKTWEYSLFDIRPSSYQSSLAQLTGKKNINGTCSDYQQKPIWKYMQDKNYRVGIFEIGTDGQNGLERSKQCEEGKDYLSDIVLWKMAPRQTGDNYFHANEKANFAENKVYYDRSCAAGECFSSIDSNIKSLYKIFTKSVNNHFFLVRDESYAKAIKSKKIEQAQQILIQINRALLSFLELAQKDRNMLVIVSTVKELGANFPRSGKEWKNITKSSLVLDGNSKLIGSLFAFGARSENFCGIYDQSEILSRIFSGAKQQGLEFMIINPFQGS